jgi:NitT/TauT family transport system substrate-binding protein
MIPSRLGFVLIASLLVGAACGAPTPTAPASGAGPAPGAAAPSAAQSAPGGAPAAAASQPGGAAGTANPSDAAPAAALPPLQPAVPVKVAFVQSIGNAGIYVALERGYFQEQGLDVETSNFRSTAEFMPSLARGDIQVGTADINAGFLNILGREVDLRFVADRGTTPPGAGWYAVMVRSGLAEQFHDYSDLKGRTISLSFEGAFNHWLLGVMLERGGLTFDDVNVVFIPPTDVAVALANGTLDVIPTFEPTNTVLAENGWAVRWRGVDEILPNAQIVVMAYAPRFADEQPEAARRWMLAYLKGVREYNDAYQKGINRDAVVQMLTQATAVKDPATWNKMVWPALHPDGTINVASIREGEAWFQQQGMVRQRADLDRFVDPSFAEWAVAQLGGPYR